MSNQYTMRITIEVDGEYIEFASLRLYDYASERESVKSTLTRVITNGRIASCSMQQEPPGLDCKGHK